MSILSYLRNALRANWKADCNSRVDAWVDSVQDRLDVPERPFVICIDRVNLDKYCSGKPVLDLDFNPLPYWTAEELIEVQTNPQKEVKTMAQVFDKNGKAHNAINFVICVDEGSTSLLTQGKVYANLGSFGGQHDNIWVIDDRGLKQNFSRERFQPFVKENLEWAQAVQPKVNLEFGKLYRVSKTKDGASTSAPSNQIYCVDETGSWMVYGCPAFKRNIKVTYSEQYLAAKMQAAYGKKEEQPKALVLDFNALERRVMTAAAIVQEEPIRYAQVQFEDGGKLYTYKYRGQVNIGDEAVVRVENKMYPELCGTKVVEVVNVLDHNPTHYDLKWLVSVVDLGMYRARQQAEENLKAAEAALDKRVQEMMRGDMLRMMAERDPEIAMLLKSIDQLKSLL
uniref:Uncharacterized protein n=2 Tax=unclassified Rosemountvirus TaxID=2738372 RepID=A0AAU8GJW9_9CAUD